MRHLVLIPAYNPGPRLRTTVEGALRQCPEVWVVVDGSTDGSEQALEELCAVHPGLRVMRRARRGGKGTAVLDGARAAQAEGFTHALVMDADDQHPAASIPEFLEASQGEPEAMILGQPVFDASAPAVRLAGRQLSVALARFEVLGPWVGDPLFGFRVYPVAPLLRALAPAGRGRSYDFDHEALVRLFWAGVPAVRRDARCRYFAAAEGGVSHFRYVRDNLRLIWLHTRLILSLVANLGAARRAAARQRQREHASEPDGCGRGTGASRAV